MKLGRIGHIRCGEWDASTFVWCPDDLTEEQFETIVHQAAKDYETALKEFKEANPPPKQPSFNLDYRVSKTDEIPDEMTFGEYRKQKEEYDAERKAWDEKHKRINHGLMPFLREQGIRPFWDVGDDDIPLMEAEVNWGHQHGVSIEYNETDVPSSYNPRGEEDDTW